MKFVMTLVLAATFATPAFASENDASKSKTVSEKNRADLVMITQTKKSDENENDRYRLKNLEDPNAKQVGESKKTWSVSPWLGEKRKRILTPPEYRTEEQYGKNSTYIGSEVGKNYKKAYGAKVKVKFGGARQ